MEKLYHQTNYNSNSSLNKKSKLIDSRNSKMMMEILLHAEAQIFPFKDAISNTCGKYTNILLKRQ